MTDALINLGVFNIQSRRLIVGVNLCAADFHLNPGSNQKCAILKGLVDTGATTTIVDYKFVKELSLINTGGKPKEAKLGDSRMMKTTEHYADVTILGNKTDDNETENHPLVSFRILAAENLPQEIIIGMDVISKWSMRWDGPINQVQIRAIREAI